LVWQKITNEGILAGEPAVCLQKNGRYGGSNQSAKTVRQWANDGDRKKTNSDWAKDRDAPLRKKEFLPRGGGKKEHCAVLGATVGQTKKLKRQWSGPLATQIQ